jgi:hypothetical protein
MAYSHVNRLLSHKRLTKGRITQQSSPERDICKAFDKNVLLETREGDKFIFSCFKALIVGEYFSESDWHHTKRRFGH